MKVYYLSWVKKQRNHFFPYSLILPNVHALPFGLRASGILGVGGEQREVSSRQVGALHPALPYSKAPEQSYFRENGFSSKAELL